MNNAFGSVRIGNKRKGSLAKANSQEVSTDVDRMNPILGNKYVLKNADDSKARDNVIVCYNTDYEADFLADGPMARATKALARRVMNGEKLILMCWCCPKPCHANLIIAKIRKIIEEAGYEVDDLPEGFSIRGIKKSS